MDKTDRKILRELQKNARLTNQELAENINLSPSPCLRRLKILEGQGFIQGYTAVLDEAKLGYAISTFVLVKLSLHSKESIDKFESAIQNIDNIMACYLIAGDTDYLLRIVCKDLADYDQFIRTRLNKVPGIASMKSNFAIRVVKKSNNLPD